MRNRRRTKTNRSKGFPQPVLAPMRPAEVVSSRLSVAPGASTLPLLRLPFALIRGLFGGRSPTAIVRFVVAVVVDSIKTPPFGTEPHISEEVLERFQPTLANGNPSPAISLKEMSVWVQTTSPHADPTSIRRSRGIGMPVSGIVAGTLLGHLDLLCRGVVGQGVGAPLPPYYTRFVD